MCVRKTSANINRPVKVIFQDQEFVIDFLKNYDQTVMVSPDPTLCDISLSRDDTPA